MLKSSLKKLDKLEMENEILKKVDAKIRTLKLRVQPKKAKQGLKRPGVVE